MELLIIGLDGLSWNMLRRFDIEPPYIDRVRSEGVSGDLMSVDTPTTLPAWTSFATGKDPGSHGRTNMVRQAADYTTQPLDPAQNDVAIYDLLDDSVFINLPASIGRIPAAEDSHLVSAMLAEDKEDAVPEDLKQLDAFEEYVLNHDKALKVNPDKYFEHVCEITRRRRDFAREAFETYDPRIGFVLFSTPDWAGHLLGNFSGDGPRRRYYSQLLTVVDECTADLGAMAENVLLMSDHGFEQKTKNIHLNDWLRDAGYLEEEASGRASARAAVSIAKLLGQRSDWLYERMRSVYNYIIATDVGQSLQEAAEVNIRYPDSRAWQLRYGCVYVNDDRFDQPTVSDAERDGLVDELVEGIRNVTDENGERAFRDVLRSEQAYADPGPWAPDVIARPAPNHFPTTLSSPTGGYVSPTNSFGHRYRGIFAATGPMFTEERTIDGMSIVDVLPTVLAATANPLSPEFDGRPRLDVLAGAREPEYLSPDDLPTPRSRSDDESTQRDRDDAVMDRLEDLGYLE